MRQSSRMQNLNISKNRKRNWHTNCIQVHTSQTNCWMFMMCSVFFALFTLALTRTFSSLNSVQLFSTNQPLKILPTVVDQFRVSVFLFFFLLDKKSRRQRRWSRRAFQAHTHHRLSAAYILSRNQLLSTYVTLSHSEASSCATQWKMWLLKVFSAICKLSIIFFISIKFI